MYSTRSVRIAVANWRTPRQVTQTQWHRLAAETACGFWLSLLQVLPCYFYPSWHFHWLRLASWAWHAPVRPSLIVKSVDGRLDFRYCFGRRRIGRYRRDRMAARELERSLARHALTHHFFARDIARHRSGARRREVDCRGVALAGWANLTSLGRRFDPRSAELTAEARRACSSRMPAVSLPNPPAVSLSNPLKGSIRPCFTLPCWTSMSLVESRMERASIALLVSD